MICQEAFSAFPRARPGPFQPNTTSSLLLAMILALGLTGAAFAAESKGYTDVEKHWGKEYIDAVTEKGLIDGKTGPGCGGRP